jgi:hypothetical protein
MVAGCSSGLNRGPKCDQPAALAAFGHGRRKVELNGTATRLTRSSLPFRPAALRRRRFLSPAPGEPAAARLELGDWHEGSLGDPMHKLILVLAGQVDVEGVSGGGLVLPNHLIFVPAERQFNLRTPNGTVVDVVHLDPGDAPWRHEGCWVTAAPTLAHEMIAYLYCLDAGRDAGRQVFRTLSHMCFDWFANPRMLFVPATRSPELKTRTPRWQAPAPWPGCPNAACIAGASAKWASACAHSSVRCASCGRWNCSPDGILPFRRWRRRSALPVSPRSLLPSRSVSGYHRANSCGTAALHARPGSPSRPVRRLAKSKRSLTENTAWDR